MSKNRRSERGPAKAAGPERIGAMFVSSACALLLVCSMSSGVLGSRSRAAGNSGASGGSARRSKREARRQVAGLPPCGLAAMAAQSGLPGTPTGLAAYGVSTAQIDLVWLAPSGGNQVVGYHIYRQIQGSAAQPGLIATTCAGFTSYPDTGLNGGTYVYNVKAFNAAGESSASSPVTATAQSSLYSVALPPNAPVASLIVVSSTEVALSWTESTSPVNGFFIERQTGNAVYSQIAQVSGTATSYSDTTLTRSTTYSYEVIAVSNETGDSSPSTAVSGTTLSSPVPPTNFTAAAKNASEIDLAWTESSTNADGFSFEREASGGSFAQIATVAGNVLSYADTDPALQPSTPYSYRMRAFSNSSGYSSYSATVNLSTPASIAAPTNLAATAVSSAEVDLSWSYSGTQDDGLRVERKVGPSGTYAEIASLAPPSSPGTMTYQDLEVVQNTQYYYRVRAYSLSLGNSAYSNEAPATTPIPPAAPTGLTATAAPSMIIKLAWTNNANNATQVNIERKMTSSGSYVQINTVGPTMAAYQDSGLQAGVTYYYRVRAYSSTLGYSSYSNEAGATALPNPAPTLSGIAPATGVNTGGTSVTVTGTGFLSGATVTIGGVGATSVTVASGTSITAVTGAHANGAADVVVTNTDSQSATLSSGFTYTNPPPVVSAISPASGLTGGGLGFTITGSAFATGATVTLGGTAATGITVVSATSITGTTPAHAAGQTDVVVTNPDGGTGSLHNGFIYTNPAPTVASISPATGLTTGGTAVTITGSGFLSGAAVKIGGTAATSISVVSGTSITATTPAHAVGAADVVVTNTDNQSATLSAGFTYVNPPPATSSVGVDPKIKTKFGPDLRNATSFKILP